MQNFFFPVLRFDNEETIDNVKLFATGKTLRKYTIRHTDTLIAQDLQLNSHMYRIQYVIFDLEI